MVRKRRDWCGGNGEEEGPVRKDWHPCDIKAPTAQLTMASIDSQLFVSDPDSRKFLEFPLKFTFRLM
ncbi:hypothetical protein EYF80_035187 [Liparis tanakae]|uniref:Uncharacterized protein n=1 Tax=Liparis tanakae TaxID=230148 RepID=A0A4Z2GN28_9TELE|nr:hypothetical protein EYF80_035187 [Liparis tanakae]